MTWPEVARRRAARLIDHLALRVFVPLCKGGCRQPVTRCACTWLPPLPDEFPEE